MKSTEKKEYFLSFVAYRIRDMNESNDTSSAKQNNNVQEADYRELEFQMAFIVYLAVQLLVPNWILSASETILHNFVWKLIFRLRNKFSRFICVLHIVQCTNQQLVDAHAIHRT